jgi:hypothetical protein
MATNFKELKRLVRLSMPNNTDGVSEMAIEEGINRAHKAIARVQEFEELTVLDTTNAATVANQKTYHIIDDLALDRPKDILTIRYMAEAESRKLTWVPLHKYDTVIPYPELFSSSKPKWYITRGMYIDLHPIPADAANLYITHTQWPAVLVNDTDETPFLNIDDVIVTLASEIALAIMNKGVVSDWTLRAKELLGIVISEVRDRPDQLHIAQPFSTKQTWPSDDYWLNPWYKGS